MKNENTVASSLVTKHPIPPSDLERHDFSNTHKSLNFSDLLRRYTSCLKNTESFIHQEGITFRAHVGRQLMTGNELLYYPELAKKIREIADYPILKRSHEVDKTIEGLEFFKYFYEYANECLNEFQVEFKQLSNQVDEFIDLYGQERYVPLIDNVALVKKASYNGSYYIESQAVVINGVKWPVSKRKGEAPKNCPRETDYLSLRRLLSIPYELEYLYLEDFMADTPFIQIRLAKSWQHKGHTKWYNLDTRQPVSRAEALCWVKPV